MTDIWPDTKLENQMMSETCINDARIHILALLNRIRELEAERVLFRANHASLHEDFKFVAACLKAEIEDPNTPARGCTCEVENVCTACSTENALKTAERWINQPIDDWA